MKFCRCCLRQMYSDSHPLEVLMSTGCSPVWSSTLMVAFTSPAASIPVDTFGSDDRTRLLASRTGSGFTLLALPLWSVRLSELASACCFWFNSRSSSLVDWEGNGNTKGNINRLCSSAGSLSSSDPILVWLWPSWASVGSGVGLVCVWGVGSGWSSFGFLLSFSAVEVSVAGGGASRSSALFWLRVWRTASSDIPFREVRKEMHQLLCSKFKQNVLVHYDESHHRYQSFWKKLTILLHFSFPISGWGWK